MFKGRQFDKSLILLCVRWYLAYSLSLRDLKEMMAQRGIDLDHFDSASLGRLSHPKIAGAPNRTNVR